ncbi:plasmid replication, integration and excision activator [Microtetraspora malaysiensis]|uniref:plasmid replication, integration and excision activator n=1 Tax=Microtetraspora malaysiensis TaxID=161358 RepID=UPI003D8C193A
MAIQGPIPISFDLLFPHGCYVVGEIGKAKDFDAKGDAQARDKTTGLPIWQVPVMDADPSLKAAAKTVTVKLLAEAEPTMPPSLPGLPFTPVEFEGIEVRPYVNQSTGRLAYSITARAMRAPRPVAGGKQTSAGKEVAA